MAIGTSKLILGGKAIVPAGSQTFNTSGTFTVPLGVTKVNITGVGGTGSAGNAGSSGNPGTGAPGGSGGVQYGWLYCSGGYYNPGCEANGNPGNLVNPYYWYYNSPWNGAGGGAGAGYYADWGGNASKTGNAGSPGNAGSVGNASSGLSKTFNGGNAGNGGAGSPGGQAGTVGQSANPLMQGSPPPSVPYNNSSYVSGNNTGGGSGGQSIPHPFPGFGAYSHSASGGGGAGDVNDGQNYNVTEVNSNCQPVTTIQSLGGNPGGGRGGIGGGNRYAIPVAYWRQQTNPQGFGNGGVPSIDAEGGYFGSNLRAGGGGGGAKGSLASGSGGGRGQAAPGGSAGNPGNAGTPATYNCIPVTPGGSYPVTVGGPSGGQVKISWCKQ